MTSPLVIFAVTAAEANSILMTIGYRELKYSRRIEKTNKEMKNIIYIYIYIYYKYENRNLII